MAAAPALPGVADLLDTIAAGAVQGLSFQNIASELTKQVAFALIPVAQFAAPLQVVGQQLAKILGTEKKVLPIHAWILQPNLVAGTTGGQVKAAARPVDAAVHRDLLERELGRPAAYVEAYVAAEAVAQSSLVAALTTSPTQAALEAWKKAVGKPVKQFLASGQVVYQVTADQLEAAGLEGSLEALRKRDRSVLQLYDNWAQRIDLDYRDGGEPELAKRFKQPGWKAQTLYWRVRYDLAKAGQPSPELTAALQLAIEKLHAAQVEEFFPGAQAAAVLPYADMLLPQVGEQSVTIPLGETFQGEGAVVGKGPGAGLPAPATGGALGAPGLSPALLLVAAAALVALALAFA